MAAVSAPSFGKLIDVYANQGLPFLPGPFWGGHFLTRLGKSDDSPLDQIDAIFKKVILIPKSDHLPPPILWDGLDSLQPQHAIFEWLHDSPSDLTPERKSGT